MFWRLDSKHLIQQKTQKAQKKIKLWKTTFSKEIVENADLHKPV